MPSCTQWAWFAGIWLVSVTLLGLFSLLLKAWLV